MRIRTDQFTSKAQLHELKMESQFLTSFGNKMNHQVAGDGLAIIRICFGILMAVDTINERGFSVVDIRWSDPDKCHFPIVSSLKPLPYKYIVAIYSLMLISK